MGVHPEPGYDLAQRLQRARLSGQPGPAVDSPGAAGAATARIDESRPVTVGDLPVPVAAGQPAVETLQVHEPGNLSPSQSLTPGVDLWLEMVAHPQLRRAVNEVRGALAEGSKSKDENDRRLTLLVEAQAGDPKAEAELKAQIAQVLQEQKLFVPGKDPAQIVDVVFDCCWGLDVLAPIYADPSVEEIRVNSPDRIYTMRLGRSYLEPIQFADEDHLKRVIRRVLLHDRIDITRDQPRVETTRRDGCRVTASIPPFTRTVTMVIRKFSSISITEAEFLRYRSLSPRILRMLKALAKGRASILLSGGTGTGKTTMLRLLVSFLPPRLRILTLETDFELNLRHYFPGRDIVEMEEHKELSPPITLQEAFKTILRMTPDVIIMGESRSGEADEMVKAAMRGHDGSMGTVHVSSVPEIIPAVCNMILEEKPHRPLPVLREQVATAFQILVQLVRWPSGWKMIEEICECYYDHGRGEVVYNPLVKWKWAGDDPEQGEWVFPNRPSPRLIEKLRRGGVTTRELQEAEMIC